MKHGWSYERGKMPRCTLTPVRWPADTDYGELRQWKIPRRFTDSGKQRNAGFLPR